MNIEGIKMENSYKYFKNKDCKYFPCHKGLSDEFNCLFCYCPMSVSYTHLPGFESMMTKQAIDALEASDVIVGYTCLLYTSRCV